MGILAGQPITCRMFGDSSLQRRPMKRIAAPLTRMGARIELTGGERAPLTITGKEKLAPLDYELPVASAQLKSALLLAGLFADGHSRFTGMIESRDHTERLLPHFGVAIESGPGWVGIHGGQRLRAARVRVPSDISTAAFWMAGCAMIPGSRIELANISLNPSRTGILSVLKRMGARVEIEETESQPEPIGRIRVEAGPLRGTKIEDAEVPSLIDEIPMIAVLATAAEGRTEVTGAEELRVKESDRIEAVAANLRGARIETHDDHRIAMAFSIAGLSAEGTTEIRGSECVAVSYPDFYAHLRQLAR
jgi:3-phosphoshikimate 1-carboxyvinyltransferase